VDGNVVGSGNNTYPKIKAGERNIKVEKPGYTEYATTIELKPNQTITVNANLQPVSLDAITSATAEDHLTRGNLAFASGDFQKAVDEYTAALELQPSFKEAYQKRAEAYLKSGNTPKAVDDYIRLGEVYRMAKQINKAVGAFNSALSYDAKNKIAMVGRGSARLDNGEYLSALTDFEAAVKIDDQFYPALFGCGVGHFRLGNNKQADKYFKNAYKLNQSDPYLYQYMMLNYLALDDVKKLKKVYADYKAVASPQELAELKSSSRFAPIIRLIEEEAK
jgi:tetratricopeptide (TPR) repeat protein